jgi:small nuclear ribonucleoprotein (snRNP)-like protein
MITRQLRLNTSDQIKNRLREFRGKKINIVLNDRTVMFGELKSLDDTTLTFLNMRLDPVTLPIANINEVYLDFKE